MKISTPRAFALAVLLVALGGVALAATDYDFNNYTLDPPPPKGGKFDVHQAAALTGKWDKNGVVRLAVISDHNQGYELWSGVELINVKNEKVYNVDAVRCFVSFCLYVGKVPPGKYFINRLYSDSFAPVSLAPIRKTSATIRNALGSFDVRVHFMTDLGMVGIYRDVPMSRDRSFQTAFLGYFGELAQLFAETYRGYQDKYFGLTGPELHWDAEWEKGALPQSQPTRRFFADFSRRQTIEHRQVFPTTMGAIYSLDFEHGLTRGEVGSLFMLTAISMVGDRWIAGTEAGRLYVSTDRGATWSAVDAFPRDEIVAHVFERDGVPHALTVSQPQAVAKLYRAGDDMTFAEIARTGFPVEGKSKKPRLLVSFAGARESLMVTYLNRLDLKKVRVLECGDFLTVQLGSRQFASFNFAANAWMAYGMPQPVEWVSSNADGITMMSHRDGGMTTIQQIGPGLGSQRSRAEINAVPRGGLDARKDGTRVAILSLLDGAPSTDKPPPAQIYVLADGAPPKPVRALDDVGYFWDSELREIDGDLVLIDRVAPRVHRFTDENVTTYSVYEP